MKRENIDTKQDKMPQTRLSLCSRDSEWKLARNYRQKYFFDKQPMGDPYTWTFEHKYHRHFVLYNGSDLAGYAHIQLWPKNRAAVRIIAIDHKQRGQSFGTRFMQLLESWLRDQGYEFLHAEASPEALKFYFKLGYTQMPFNDPDGYEGGENDTEVGKVL